MWLTLVEAASRTVPVLVGGVGCPEHASGSRICLYFVHLKEILSLSTSPTTAITRPKDFLHCSATHTCLQNPLVLFAPLSSPTIFKNHDSIAEFGKHDICATETAAILIAAKNKYGRA